MRIRFIASFLLIGCLVLVFNFKNIRTVFDQYREKNSIAEYNALLAMPFNEAFQNYYEKNLDSSARNRSRAFSKIFLLAEEQKNKTGKEVIIVETGSMRKSYFRFTGDGSSTLLFNHFLNGNITGEIYTVDLDPKCKEIIEDIYKLKHVSAFTMDSVEYLRNFQNPEAITILYLDSYDINFKAPEKSAKHHLEEIKAVFEKLSPGTIVAIDDNKIVNGKNVGKGYLVEEFFQDKPVKLVYDGYVKVFQIEPKF